MMVDEERLNNDIVNDVEILILRRLAWRNRVRNRQVHGNEEITVYEPANAHIPKTGI